MPPPPPEVVAKVRSEAGTSGAASFKARRIRPLCHPYLAEFAKEDPDLVQLREELRQLLTRVPSLGC